MNKQKLIDLAEIGDAHRIFEKAMLAGYGLYVLYVLSRCLQFFFDLPHEARTPEVTAFCTLVITALTGFSAPLLNAYVNARRQWPTAPTTTTEIKSTTTGA